MFHRQPQSELVQGGGRGTEERPGKARLLGGQARGKPPVNSSRWLFLLTARPLVPWKLHYETLCLRLESRTLNPRRELFVADPLLFTFGSLATRHGDDFVKDSMTYLFDGFGSVEDCSRIDVHVVAHPIVES